MVVVLCACMCVDEGSLNVQLALGPMNLAPTFVYENEVPAEVVEPPADGSTPPLETSVRYFFRPIVYTDHEKEVRDALM